MPPARFNAENVKPRPRRNERSETCCLRDRENRRSKDPCRSRHADQSPSSEPPAANAVAWASSTFERDGASKAIIPPLPTAAGRPSNGLMMPNSSVR